MPEWITWAHVVLTGVLSSLASFGFMPPVRAIIWNLIMKSSGVPVERRQRILEDAARRHQKIPDRAPPDPAQLKSVESLPSDVA